MNFLPNQMDHVALQNQQPDSGALKGAVQEHAESSG